MSSVYHQVQPSDNTNNLLFLLELYGCAIHCSKRFNVECAPLINKIPFEGYQFKRKAGVFQAQDQDWHNATGYCIAPIPGDSLHILDIDNYEFYLTVIGLLPILKTAFTVWRGKHCHVYVRLAKGIKGAYLTHKDINHHEVASLRGPGSYVVGQYSTHESGEKYLPQKGATHPAQLDDQQTDLLINLFSAPLPDRQSESPVISDSEKQQLVLDHKLQVNKRLIQELINIYMQNPTSRQRVDRNGDIWINTSCPNAEYHKRSDHKVSFGLNTTKGYGKCFTCNRTFKIKHLAKTAGIDINRLGGVFEHEDRPTTESLTASGASQSRMISDLMDSDMRPALTRRDLVDLCKGLGWSESKAYKAIKSAVDHNRITELSEGVFQRKSPILRGRLRYDESAYKRHVINYRLAVTLEVQAQIQKEVLQSPNGISSPTSADKLARRVGVSKATLYRYESPKLLNIEKHQLFARFDLPEQVAIQQRLLSQPRAGARLFLDVLSRRGNVIKRIDPNSREWDDPSVALGHAKALAYRWRGKVVLCEQRPSIRLLPGQQLNEILPLGATVSRAGNVYLDRFQSMATRLKGKNGNSAQIPLPTHLFKNFNHLLENASQGISNRTKDEKPDIKGFTSLSIGANALLIKAQEARQKAEWKEYRDSVAGAPNPDDLKAWQRKQDANKTPEESERDLQKRQRYWAKRDDFINNNRRKGKTTP